MYIGLEEILSNIFVSFLIMYIYPRFVFSTLLKNKSFLYKFFFCYSVMLVGLSVVVIGVFYFCTIGQAYYFTVIFYSVLVISLITKIVIGLVKYKKNILKSIIARIKEYFINLKNSMSWNVLFLAVSIVICMYTSFWYIYRSNYFVFSDMYVHCEWVFDMLEGKIFGDGIYPFGMHCCLYAMTVITTFEPAFLYLYLPVLQNFALFLGFYALTKSIFKSHYVATIPILLFGIFYVLNIYGPTDYELTNIAFNRLIVCLPQEFCLYAVFAGMFSLINYFKLNLNSKDKKTKGFEYLILYSLCVAATITSHLYCAFFLLLCTISVFVCYVWKQKVKRILSLFVSGIIGVILGVFPYLVYYTKFPKFEESIYWGLKVILGWRKLDYVSVAGSDNSISSEYKGQTADTIKPSNKAPSIGNTTSSNVKSNSSGDKSLIGWLSDIYNNSFVPFFGNALTPVFVLAYFVAIGLSAFLLIRGYKKLKNQKALFSYKKHQSDVENYNVLKREIAVSLRGYASLLVCLLLYYIFYASPVLGIPRLMESYRLVLEMYVFFTACLIIPVDIFYRQFSFRVKEKYE